MVGHGGSSAGSYLADPTSPIPSQCASIVATSTLRVNFLPFVHMDKIILLDTFIAYTPSKLPASSSSVGTMTTPAESR